MPILLRVLLIVTAGQLALDAVGLAFGWADADGGTRVLEGAALVLDAGILVALSLGIEWVRRLARLGAALGFAIDAVLLTLLVGYAAGAAPIATGAVLLAGSALTLWALGHPSVQAWTFERWVARTEAPPSRRAG